MRKFLLSISVAIISCFAIEANATDIIYGNCHYKELDGQYAGVKKTESYAVFPSDDRISLVYCLRIPRATVSAVARLVPKITGNVTLNVTVTDCETGALLVDYSSVQEGSSGKEMTMPLIPETEFPSDTWYKVELKAPNGSSVITRLVSLEFERTGNDPVCDAHLRGFPTPATHLWFDHSTEEAAPKSESYDWCYQEVLMPEQWATINTYLMTLGITGGYMGIQMAGKTVPNERGEYTDTIRSAYTHQALFSIWDNGDTDVTPNLPDYLRAGALAYGKGVTINHFGNEGTGCQAMITNAKWNPGQWVQFLTLARPEEVDVDIKDETGNIIETIKYPNSLLSTWYKTTDDPEWHYMATIRHSGESHYWNTWYSFIENWADTGGELFRRAYYRNNYQHSIGSGKWYFVNKAGFSQTTYQDFINSGEISVRQRRMDYGHGLASDVDRAFFMQTGGYGQAKDSLNVLPMVYDHSVVESINLDSLAATVNDAYIADGYGEVQGAFAGVTNDEDILAVVQNYINKTDRFGGYAKSDMQELLDLYADPDASVTSLRRKMLMIGKRCMPLKYGNVVKAEHVSSFKTYQLKCTNGVLVVSNGKLAALPVEEVDVTNPDNNWLILRHDDEPHRCLYNLGTGKYLVFTGDAVTLSDNPAALSVGKTARGFTFKDGKYLTISKKQEVTASASASSSGSVFTLSDNYYLTPDTELCYSLLEATTSEAIANGIDEITIEPNTDELLNGEGDGEIIGIAYYELDGRRAGFALQSGHTYIARLLTSKGTVKVRKIVVK